MGNGDRTWTVYTGDDGQQVGIGVVGGAVYVRVRERRSAVWSVPFERTDGVEPAAWVIGDAVDGGELPGEDSNPTRVDGGALVGLLDEIGEHLGVLEWGAFEDLEDALWSIAEAVERHRNGGTADGDGCEHVNQRWHGDCASCVDCGEPIDDTPADVWGADALGWAFDVLGDGSETVAVQYQGQDVAFLEPVGPAGAVQVRWPVDTGAGDEVRFTGPVVAIVVARRGDDETVTR